MRANGLRRGRGFSLIEVIIALVIFSLIIIACVRALSGIIGYVERDRNVYQDQNRLQRTWNIVLQDLLHMRPRTERDRLGGVTRAYQTDIENYDLLFTRGGLPSISGTLGGLQRVAYSIDDEGQFIRWTWPAMDMYEDENPNSQVLMGGIQSLEFWQLNASNEYEQNWPPLNEQLQNNALPRLIKLVINLENGNSIERVIPGLEMPDGAGASSSGGGNAGGSSGGNADGDAEVNTGEGSEINEDGEVEPR